MPHKLRKVRKMRGSRTHGYGVIGQHRGIGAKGHRTVGRHKGGWTYTVKYEPDYFGKKGFTPRGGQQKRRAINVDELATLITELSKEQKVEKKSGKVILDLKALGYDKLLGRGKITQPLVVKGVSCSETAVKKIEAVGGQVLSDKAK
ncbi:MAG: 50S ribosomal protein L15 [Candidatus Bathyarchaeota archaeon]|nr:50S ribosomal protein L15 [Candidatus Bathyarchaeota archaeon]